ncbi:hypothetical protein EB001_25440 [bacterium]|nr:hypothetical protein [bacterium]
MINFPTIIVDNFYKQPDKIREFALKQEYLDSPGNYPGKRTKKLHELNRDLFDGFCSKLFSLYYTHADLKYSVDTSFWKVGTLDSDPTSPKNMGFIHNDNCLFAGVIYLIPGFNFNLGTTIYSRIKEKTQGPNPAMKRYYSTGEDIGFDDYILENNSAYEQTIKIGNVYNRLISFDKSVPHAPSHYYMGDETRLVQVFFVHKIESSISSPIRRIQDYDNIPYDSL